MRKIAVMVAGGMMLLASQAVAQDTSTIIFGIYYRCTQGQETRADQIVQNTLGPIVQKHVDAGSLTGWLWLTHEQGGAWRRVFAVVGTDLNTMMDVREQNVEEFTSQHGDEAAELGSVCPGHDDYIWTSVATSTPDPDLVGPATLSTYHACDTSRQGRADEIFEEVLAPLYQKHMDLGHLASWGFYAHRAGGRFRRLETLSGADHKTLLAMQAAIYEEASDTNPFEIQELAQICNSHVDYMWSNAGQ